MTRPTATMPSLFDIHPGGDLHEVDPLHLDTPPAGMPPAAPAGGGDTPVITISVRGNPAPQGSKRHVGRGIMVESSKHLKPWREAVRSTASEIAGLEGLATLDEPLLLDMVFSASRPRGHYRTGRNAHLLREGAPTRPAGKPDLSKLARSTEDALKDAGVYFDDARIVEYGRLAKVYCGEDPDALGVPGALIRIYRYRGGAGHAA